MNYPIESATRAAGRAPGATAAHAEFGDIPKSEQNRGMRKVSGRNGS